MGCEVYANGMTIACKAADGKTVAAMPDTCLSPPPPPAGPAPLPYPNTAYATDTTKGSKTVRIGGKEVMLKNKSTFKKSTGDEAATKSFGMGVVSHQIQGEVNFCAWSMDVKFEGENVPRHLDLTLHNEMCNPANTPPWVYTDRMAFATAAGDACKDERKAVDDNCKKDAKGKVQCPAHSPGQTKEAYAKQIESDACQRAARCMLSTYSPSRCCDPQTPHHVVPKAGFFSDKYGGAYQIGCGSYNADKAPCVCAEGGKSVATHGMMHDEQTRDINKTVGDGHEWSYSQASKSAAECMHRLFPQCSSACIEAQIHEGHKEMGIGPKATPVSDPKLRPIRQQPSEIAAFSQEFKAVQSAFGTQAPATSVIV